MKFQWLVLCVFASGCGNGSDRGKGACAPGGAPVMHSANITADETWASGVHVVPSTIHVQSGAHLTIAACSDVQLGSDAAIVVDATAGGLVARGDASNPITFEPQQPAPWGSLQATAPATIDLAFATLKGGGGAGSHSSAPFGGASLVGQGDVKSPPKILGVDHVTISGSTGLGVFVRGARFTDASAALTISASGYYPVYGGIASASSLPSGTYTGNAIDQILLQSIGPAAYEDSGPLLVDATLHDRGLPYRVGLTPSSIRVGSGVAQDPGELLTIEANVTILFTPQGTGGRSQLIVNGIDDGAGGSPQGALVVLGTAATPVTFDSAADVPAAGDWQGLYFAHFVDPRTTVAGAVIADAGGNSGSVGVCENAPGSGHAEADCAVDIFVDTAPAAFLQMSTIRNSALCGVYRGWKASDVDFTANEFDGVPGCVQTNVPDASNACPATACITGT